MDDIKVLAKNQQEQEKLIKVIRIYSLDIEMEFAIEKCDLLIMKNRKRESQEGID